MPGFYEGATGATRRNFRCAAVFHARAQPGLLEARVVDAFDMGMPIERP